MARKKRKKKKGLRGILPDISLHLKLDLDQWLDIAGYGLLTIAGLTLLSFLSASHGTLPAWWLRILRGVLGWGAYLMPLLVGAVGLWLVLRQFGDKLPQVSPWQFGGALTGYVLLLVTLHLLASLFFLEGDMRAIAEAGLGGGRVGAAIGLHLLRGVGVAGTLVALLFGWVIIVAVTFRVTLEEILRTLGSFGSWLRSRRSTPLPETCLLYTSPSPRDRQKSRMPSSA